MCGAGCAAPPALPCLARLCARVAFSSDTCAESRARRPWGFCSAPANPAQSSCRCFVRPALARGRRLVLSRLCLEQICARSLQMTDLSFVLPWSFSALLPRCVLSLCRCDGRRRPIIRATTAKNTGTASMRGATTIRAPRRLCHTALPTDSGKYTVFTVAHTAVTTVRTGTAAPVLNHRPALPGNSAPATGKTEVVRMRVHHAPRASTQEQDRPRAHPASRASTQEQDRPCAHPASRASTQEQDHPRAHPVSRTSTQEQLKMSSPVS